MTRRATRIPAASASSPTSRAASRTRSSRTRWRSCATSNIAARSAPIRAPGDGAGILVQIPHKFFAKKAAELGITLPEPGHYAVGSVFMPRDDGMAQGRARHVRRADGARGPDAARLAPRADRQFLARRIGQADRAVPHADFHRAAEAIASENEFERRLYILRKVISQVIYNKRERRSPAITWCRCRAAPSSTRACSSPTSSASTIPTCTRKISRPRSASCTSASRPTRSRAGRSRIPTG